MSLIKLLAYGTIGYLAYRAWQHHQDPTTSGVQDDRSRTAPHGDPVLVGEQIDVSEPSRPIAHASRGFGDD